MGTIANSQKCTITATSAANQVVRTKELTVTGKTGRVLSDAVIHAQRDCNIGDQQTLTYTVYPVRVSKANNLNITWGCWTVRTQTAIPSICGRATPMMKR